MKHVVILISGTGSNMAAIVRAAEAQGPEADREAVRCGIAGRPGARR